MNQLEKGKRVSVVAAELGVMPRYIRRLQVEFRETGSAHVLRLPGRPALQPPSQEKVRPVSDACRLEKVGVMRAAISLRSDGHKVCNKIHNTYAHTADHCHQYYRAAKSPPNDRPPARPPGRVAQREMARGRRQACGDTGGLQSAAGPAAERTRGAAASRTS